MRMKREVTSELKEGRKRENSPRQTSLLPVWTSLLPLVLTRVFASDRSTMGICGGKPANPEEVKKNEAINEVLKEDKRNIDKEFKLLLLGPALRPPSSPPGAHPLLS